MRKIELDLTGLSARNRRFMALGVRGGDGDDELDVGALLERVASRADLTDEDLAALDADLRAAGELLLEDPSDEVLAQVDQILAARDEIAATQSERVANAERIAAGAEERRARLAGDTGDEPGEGGDGGDGGDGADGASGGDGGDGADGGDGGDGGDAAPGDAAAGDGGADGGETGSQAAVTPPATDAPPAVPVRANARRPDVLKPRPKAAKELKLVASANTPGLPAGTVLDTPEKIKMSFESALRATAGYRGPRVNIPLFTLGAFDPAEIYGEQRTLRRDAQENELRIEAVAGPQALRASGGICAPVPVQYDLPILGTDARPVRDSLARFGADRGGVRLLPPPQLSDMEGAVDVWTEANDQDPGSDGPETKPCLTLDCPDDVETLVAAITQCLKIGNFRARFFPEQVEAWTRLVAVHAARVAENRILQKIGDLSTQVAVTEILGTTRTVLAALDRAAASMRSHHRLDPQFPLRFQAPYWLLNNMITDLAREMPGATDERLAMSEAQIQAFFTVRHINVSWFLDGESGQIFGAQLDGALNGWPDEVISYLYVEGTWLHLDAGMLDFGLVRDSTLNATNDFQLFSEIFEEAAFHGVEGTSLRLAIDICPNGQAAALDDTSGICTSGS